MNIDTLSIAKDLRAAELPAEQAEAIATAIGRSVNEGSATKADLNILESGLRTEIEKLRTEIEKSRNQTIIWLIGAQVALTSIMIALLRH